MRLKVTVVETSGGWEARTGMEVVRVSLLGHITLDELARLEDMAAEGMEVVIGKCPPSIPEQSSPIPPDSVEP